METHLTVKSFLFCFCCQARAAEFAASQAALTARVPCAIEAATPATAAATAAISSSSSSSSKGVAAAVAAAPALVLTCGGARYFVGQPVTVHSALSGQDFGGEVLRLDPAGGKGERRRSPGALRLLKICGQKQSALRRKVLRNNESSHCPSQSLLCHWNHSLLATTTGGAAAALSVFACFHFLARRSSDRRAGGALL